jgi:integrase
MRGHVRKRGKTWAIVYDEGVDEHGKRVQRWRGGFASQKEAQQELTQVLGALGNQSYVEPSKVTMRAFLADEWLPAIAGTVRPATYMQYRSISKSRIIPRIGNLRLQTVSGGNLNGLYQQLSEAGLEPASIRQTHAVLSRVFRDAVRWGKLARNPAQAADPPAASENRAQSYTAKELERFLVHVQADRLAALWRLGAMTGMRRGELAGLTWRWLDLDAGTLRVEQQLLQTMTFGPPKSKRSRRQVALDAETVEILRKHRDAQLLERSFAGEAYVDHDLVFADALGGKLDPRKVTKWFGQQRKAAGLTLGTLHILRHTHITHALTNGVPLHVVAARVGDRPETILATYAHLLPTSDAAAAEQVAALVSVR